MGSDALIKSEDELKIGDVFFISNKDRPEWVKGWWRIKEKKVEGLFLCERVCDNDDGDGV